MVQKSRIENDLPGLGPKSLEALKEIGIHSRADLEQIGAIRAYVKLKKECKSVKPSLNFLYGLVGALEGRPWQEVARHDKGRLLLELESYQQLEKITGNHN